MTVSRTTRRANVRPLAAACLALALPAVVVTGPVGAADLRVAVTNIVEPKGEVLIAVYDSPETYTKNTQPRAALKLRAAPPSVTAVFADLAPGRYAIATFQDLDGDGKLAANLLGIPSEPWGLSNDARAAFSRPGFQDVAIELGAEGRAITITLNR
jgi:uncharacterized protein (DUF2141 family)